MYNKIFKKGMINMFNTKISLFASSKSLEKKIDLFHDNIIDVTMIFKKAIKTFLNEQRSDEYKKLSGQIKQVEHDADTLRRDIENNLYTRNLIPDLRGDVLQLVENLDKVVNKFDEVTYKFYVERPEIPSEYHIRLTELCSQVTECVENMVIASRSFFRNFNVVRDYAQKVYFIENETDITVEPDLKMNKVSAGLANYRNSIFVNFSNIKAAYLEDMTVDVQIMPEKKDEVLYDSKKAGMRMAPNSMIDFPIEMNGEKMVPGNYRAHVLVTAGDKRWEWDEKFTITDEEADKFNGQDVGLVQERGIDWRLIIGIAVGLLVVVVVIFVIVHQVQKNNLKKKRKQKKRPATKPKK